MLLVNPPPERLGATNALLMARGRRHSVREYPGPLSIKHVLHGEVRWKLGRREAAVDPGSFLVLHDREPYSMEINTPAPVETLCIFFERGFVEAVARDVADGSIDPVETRPLDFAIQLHRADARIVPRLRALAQPGAGVMRQSEELVLLARDLALLSAGIRERASRLPAARASTREETMKRLNRGVEFLHAHASDRIVLRDVARAACLSEFHFQRTFSAAFGVSPHEYLTGLRLERARKLLAGGGATVTEACAAAGFESLGSFSTLFRRRFGIAPSKLSPHAQV